MFRSPALVGIDETPADFGPTIGETRCEGSEEGSDSKGGEPPGADDDEPLPAVTLRSDR